MGYAWSWDDVPGLALSERSAIAAGNKTCTRCGTEKPLTEFHKTRDDFGRPRPHPWCKACRAERYRQDYAAARRRAG
jgi:transposase-like protein